MLDKTSLADLLTRGVSVQPFEAVAVAQQLIEGKHSTHELIAPLGPPALDNVLIAADGSVICTACATTPAVFEVAILLDGLLPRGGVVRVPGGLRYTIARGLLEVDVPPFDSLEHLSAALSRFENGDRQQVVAALYARARVPATVAALAVAEPPVQVERRRSAPSSAEFRRQLRETDEQLYAALIAAHTAALQSAPWSRRRGRPRLWLAGGAIAAMLAFAAGYATVEQLQPQATPVLATDRIGSTPSAGDTAALATNADASRSISSGGDSTSQSAMVGPGSEPVDTLRMARVPPQPPVTVDRTGPSDEGARVVRAVAHSAGPSFSPAFAANGTALFFHTGRTSDARSALEAANLGAPELHVMTIVDDGSRNYHVQPSPDGTRVAFDSDRDGERGVYVAKRDGTGVQRVSGPGFAAVPTWAPDGRRLAFVRAETARPNVWNLWLLHLESGDMRRLTNFRYGQTWGAAWFPDGRRVGYTHEDQFAVLELENGETRQFASPIKGRLVRTPAVSPDGRHVIFQVARSGAWLLDLDDGSMRCVLTDPTAEEFAWSPDGRRVAFHSRRDGQWGIWIMAPAS